VISGIPRRRGRPRCGVARQGELEGPAGRAVQPRDRGRRRPPAPGSSSGRSMNGRPRPHRGPASPHPTPAENARPAPASVPRDQRGGHGEQPRDRRSVRSQDVEADGERQRATRSRARSGATRAGAPVGSLDRPPVDAAARVHRRDALAAGLDAAAGAAPWWRCATISLRSARRRALGQSIQDEPGRVSRRAHVPRSRT
jgi:hypothetical protein